MIQYYWVKFDNEDPRLINFLDMEEFWTIFREYTLKNPGRKIEWIIQY